MSKLPRIAFLLALTMPVWAQDKPPDEIEYRVLKFDDRFTAFEDGLTPRLRVRANFYRGEGENPWVSSPGQVSIEYGLPVWKPEYQQAFESFPAGRRWRLGSNYWTNFSTSFPIRTGDATLPVGYYYLVLEKASEGNWKLVFLKPSDVRSLQIDAWHVDRQQSGPGVLSLNMVKAAEVGTTEKLEIRLRLKDENPKEFLVDVRFGPIHLESPWMKAEVTGAGS